MSKIIGTAKLATELQKQGQLDKFVNDLDPDGWHVLADPAFLHNDVEVRSQILLKMRNSQTPKFAFVTLPLEVYNDLPTSEEFMAKKEETNARE